MTKNEDSALAGEEEEAVKTDEQKMNELLDRKMELEILVEAIEQNLRRGGYEFRKNDYVSPILHSGIRINGELSFRGKMKARELFTRLDEDCDGKLQFEDFRAMRSLSSSHGIAHDNVMCRWESWQMAMFDNSIEVDQPEGTVNVEEFVKYRTLIEGKVPLAPDLIKAGIGYLPAVQQQWATVKRRIKEVFERRDPDGEVEFDPESLSLEEFSYVAATSGLSLSRFEIQLAMCRISRFQNCMSHLLSRALKHDLFLELPENSVANDTINGFRSASIVMPEYELTRQQIFYLKPRTLVAWIFSNREGPKSTECYQYLLKTKYHIWAAIRRAYGFASYFWEAGMHLRERLVFKQQHIKPVEEINLSDKISLGVNAEVGDEPQSGTDGTNIYWKMSKIDAPLKYLTDLGIPKDCGTTLVLDLTHVPDAKHSDVIAVCALIKKELLDHFDEELRASQQYRGLFVFPATNQADGASVIRVAFAYRRAVSVDAFLTMLGLPYSLSDIVNHFYGEIATSVHILDLVEATSSSIDLYTYITGNAFLEFNCEIVNAIVETVRIAFAAGLSTSAIFGRKPQSGNPDQWAHIREYFPIIVKLCDRILLDLKNTKSFNMGLKFAKVSDLFEKLSSKSPWLQRVVPVSLFKKIGALPPFYRSILKKVKHRVNEYFKILKADVESKQDTREAERLRRRNLSVKEKYLEDQGKTKNELLSRLSALGVEAHEKELFDSGLKTPEEYAHIEREKQMEKDASSFESMEKIRNMLVGVHTMELLLGKSKISAQFTGFEIFELLPTLPSMSSVRMACEEREKKSLFEEEMMGNEFASPHGLGDSETWNATSE